MPSDLPKPATMPLPQPPSAVKKPSSKRRKKRILIVAVVIVVALVIVFWGWSATGGEYLSVSEIVEDCTTSIPENYQGTIEVKGIVSSWSGLTDTEFVIADEQVSSDTISVTMSSAYPSGFENGKPVVVKGMLDAALPLHLTASSISVGCSSKY